MKNKAVYRRPLQEVHKENNDQLPDIFTESIDILRQRGLHCQGLFSRRSAGRKAKLLEKAWDMGRNPLKAASFTDCYAVAESLVLWLRALPSPVIPCRLFRAFLRTQRTSCQAESLAAMHLLFSQMEDCEIQTLEVLLGFLHEYYLAQRQQCFMNPSLGQIFGPALLRGDEGPLPLPFPEDLKAAASLVDFMIVDYPAVFSSQAPCCNASHKPPSGARRQRWADREQRRTDKQGRGGITQDLNSARGVKQQQQRFAASAPPCPAPACSKELPVKHLRVNVVPPLLDTEEHVDNGRIQGEGMLHQGMLYPPLPPCHTVSPPQPAADDQHVRMATVPERSPLSLSSDHSEAELEYVFDKLLCGSLENVLFADDKSHFASAVSSVSFPWSPSTAPRGDVESDRSSDEDSSRMTSDEDMLGGEISPPSTPGRSAVQPSFQPHIVAL